jgi:hypothetical protein
VGSATFTFRIPDNMTGRLSSAEMRSWLTQFLHDPHPLPPDPGSGYERTSLTLPTGLVQTAASRLRPTWANPSGESIKALQNQLGHVDSRITLGIYVQPIPEAQRQIAVKVQGVLLPIAPNLTAPGNGSERVIQ